MGTNGKELHAVSTGRQTLREWMDISKEMKEYIDCFHIREPLWSLRELRTAVAFLKEEGVADYQVRLNIPEENRRHFKEVGYHLKEAVEQKPTQCLTAGWSVHSLEAARLKEKAGADYLFFGHVFVTGSKPGLEPSGLKKLEAISEATALPVIAIGGITPERVKSCIRSGASGIAVLSGLYEAEDPKQRAYEYYIKLKEEGKLCHPIIP